MKKILFILSLALLFVMCDSGKESDKQGGKAEARNFCKIQEKYAGGSLKEYRLEGIRLEEWATLDSIWKIHFDVPGIEKYLSDQSEATIIILMDTTMNTREDLLSAIEKRGGICK
ncbi:MAG: hypothetical protein JW801_13590 [Bacteroidales bacterium]|nr:hypothetical protein [Bacteroidales bacterium]